MPETAPEREKEKGVAGTVLELLPNAAYRVELESRQQLIAHATGATKANFVRLRPKDKVLVEVAPHDRTRGRIIRLLKRK